MEKNNINLTSPSVTTTTNISSLKRKKGNAKLIVSSVVLGAVLVFSPITTLQASAYSHSYHQINQYQQEKPIFKVNDKIILPSDTATYRLKNNRLYENRYKTEEPLIFGQYKIKSIIDSYGNKVSEDYLRRNGINSGIFFEITDKDNNCLIVRSSDIIKYLGPDINPLEYNLSFRTNSPVIIPSNTPTYRLGNNNHFYNNGSTDEPYWNGKQKIEKIYLRTNEGRLVEIDYIGQNPNNQLCDFYALVNLDGRNKQIFKLSELMIFVPEETVKEDFNKPITYESVENNSELVLSPSLKIFGHTENNNGTINKLFIRWYDDEMKVHHAILDPSILFGRTFWSNTTFEMNSYGFNIFGELEEITISINGKNVTVTASDMQQAIFGYANPVKENHKPYYKK